MPAMLGIVEGAVEKAVEMKKATFAWLFRFYFMARLKIHL
jgi:hypothetical protein